MEPFFPHSNDRGMRLNEMRQLFNIRCVAIFCKLTFALKNLYLGVSF